MTLVRLSRILLETPIAHRGLHDVAKGRRENSLASFAAAIEAGYAIEMDLQASQDGVPMVFHDYHLDRLTSQNGPVAMRMAADLGKISLLDDTGVIPTLEQVLSFVDGRVPLLIEFKDQDGAMGEAVGVLQDRAADLLRSYSGDYAVMSFNPHAVARLGVLLPDVARGLVTDAFEPEDWPGVPQSVRQHLREIPDFDDVGASFISHGRETLGMESVKRVKDRGFPVLTWTIKSREQEAEARQIADNITFEGYHA